MKIFIDVNVFIDVMTKRNGWTESLRVLSLARNSREIEGSTSALTLITRNKKNFTASLLSVLTPDEWLKLPDVIALEAKLA